MIRYALKCAEGHSFESWFQSADAFDALEAKAMVSCVVCGCTDVQKAMMAPRVRAEKAEEAALPAPVPEMMPDRPLSDAPSHPAEQILRAMREHVEKNSTYVGGKFASEARAMHVGDVPEKPIHGEATADEAKALLEDGVPVLPLPVVPKDRAN
ncbi:MAG: DUF1178 family protein [Pseudomonadota bacterium]